MSGQSERGKELQLLMAVEEACRRAGGKQLLTRTEYLEIVNQCFDQIYGRQVTPQDADRLAGAG